MRQLKALPHEALRRLKWPVRLTQAGIAAERITRAFWPVWSLGFSAVAALSFGVQDILPFWALWGLAAAVALAVAVVLWRGRRALRWPSRSEGLGRLDGTLPGRPIAALQDEIAAGTDDAGSREVWRAHVARMAGRLAGARPPRPDLRLSTRDPFALRYAALTAFVVAMIFGAPARVRDVAEIVSPAGDAAATVQASWEAWAEPPAYTGRPGLYLNSVDAGRIDLPEGSRITVRLYGPADALTLEETLSGTPKAAPEAEDRPGTAAGISEMRSLEFLAIASGRLAIAGPGGREWAVQIMPDTAPSVAISGPIRRDADGAMAQNYTARDDYAVVAGRAILTLDMGPIDRRFGLAADPEAREPLIYDLPLPITGSRSDFIETLVEDASKHPWANLPVNMVFEVTDGRGQTGQSPPASLILPGRRFFDPVASAVIELRRDLLWSRANVSRVGRVLRAITHRPEGLLRNERAYLMLRVAMRRLDAALAQSSPIAASVRDEIAEDFWQIAELIEDGGLSNALARMQQAQERLSEAMRNGASPEEIQKLMDELRQATDDYIRQLAENMERKGADEPNRQAGNAPSMTGDQLQQMMDEIQRLMEEGRMAEAQELLDQLSRMMENLKVTEGQRGEGNRGQGQQSMENLRQTLRDQQGLSDETFRDLQRQFGGQDRRDSGQRDAQNGQNGQSGAETRPGEGEGGQQSPDPNGTDARPGQPGDGQGNEDKALQGNLADRQRALRDELRRQLGGLPGDPSAERDQAGRSLDEAGRAMEDAERALRQGDMADAIARQAEAIENMREGMRNLGEALAQDQGGQSGNQGQTEGNSGREVPRDPLGRSAGQNGRIGSDENMLQGEDVYRRARDLLDEIRRRSGEQQRPQAEIDYLKRLLGRY